MKRWFLALLLLSAMTGLLAADEKQSSITAHATALGVRKDLPPKKKERFMMTPPGTTLDLTFLSPARFILGVDAKASKLDQFIDDKKTKLDTSTGFGAPNWMAGLITYGPEGDRCTVQLNAQSAPSKGATKVSVKGTIVLKCGAAEKTIEQKDLAIKKDAETTAGDFTIKVIAEGSDFSGPAIQIISPERVVKNTKFFDAKGKAIELLTTPYWHNVFAKGKTLIAINYNLTKKIDKLSMQITYFSKVEDVPVPFDVSVGLGLD